MGNNDKQKRDPFIQTLDLLLVRMGGGLKKH